MQVNTLENLPDISVKTSIAIFILLLVSAIAAILLTPVYKTQATPPVLEKVVPLQMGEWVDKPSPYAQVSVNTFTQTLSDAIYDQVLMRTYEDGAKNQIMLALAFANEQRQEIKLHQPEICYPAQGYQIVAMENKILHLAGYPFPIASKRLIFKKDSRTEAVTYWMRLGDGFPTSGLGMRWKILQDGLKGKLDDGILVRVSTLIGQQSEADNAYKIHDRFLAQLIKDVGEAAPNLIVPQR